MMMIKPKISQDFTVDDIHKIREWHYEQRKEVGMEEYTKILSQKVKTILADFPHAKILKLSQNQV
jgi:plasmid stabilization system protein ParE